MIELTDKRNGKTIKLQRKPDVPFYPANKAMNKYKYAMSAALKAKGSTLA